MNKELIEKYIMDGEICILLALFQTSTSEKFSVRRKNCSFEICSNESGLYNYLEEKLSPYFIFDNPNSDFCQYKIIVHKTQEDLSVSSLFTGEMVRIVPNEKDPRKNIQARAIDFDEYRVYLMEKTDSIVIIGKESKIITVIGLNKAGIFDDCRLVIRDLTNITIVNDGYVEVHASGICDNKGNVTIICGESNSGKTTMLFNLLKDRKLNLLSNGRVYIKLKEDEVHVLGTPESIYIRPITATKFNELSELLNDIPESELHSKDCDIRYKIKTTYKDICKRFEVNPAIEGSLKTIIMPSLSNANRLENLKSDLNFEIGEHIFSYPQIKRREWVQCLSINEKEYKENCLKVKKHFEGKVDICFARLEDGSYIIEKRG